ncbi:TPA: Lrp/AsnC family transcriptional regulator [Candidatus Bathyarchaeota archaeon]|nr:Lrp/AsnC family transcriptional regulator [Candidatus Bathyarchaeota archaeon]HIJ08632.1 Lrp/AsnC family transcriptional regulator [Candidatus Bathyarchaeota archaeon]
MDKKDEALVWILARHANLSSRALSKMTGLPLSTVHRRIKRLEREGVIIGYKAVIDYEKTTKPISALLLVDLPEGSGEKHVPKNDLVAKFAKFEEIEEIIEVQAFNFDLILKARVCSLKRLSAFMEELRMIEGIEELASAIIVEEQTCSCDDTKYRAKTGRT